MADFIPINDLSRLHEIIDHHREERGCLMRILQDTQDAYGYLPFELQNIVAHELKIPITEVYGVATFYSQFSLKPKGENCVSVCLGTACYVRGSQEILDKVCEILQTPVGETSEDGKFSVDATRCVGACGLAPVMMINDEVFGRLTAKEVPDILKKYK